MKPVKGLILSSLLGLVACSSAPVHYYTLQPAVLPVAAGAARAAAPFQLEVMPVGMPAQVDQSELVIRQNNGRLAILDNDRWSAALGDEFQLALSGQLEQALGVRDLHGLPLAPEQPVLQLRADVRRFESVPGYYALVDMVWSLKLQGPDHKERVLNCGSQVRQTTGPVDLASLVQAHQQVIARRAMAMAGAARRWAADPAAGCP